MQLACKFNFRDVDTSCNSKGTLRLFSQSSLLLCFRKTQFCFLLVPVFLTSKIRHAMRLLTVLYVLTHPSFQGKFNKIAADKKEVDCGVHH